MSDEIKARDDGAVLELTIDRPDRKNALNLAMYAALAEHIEQAPERGMRVILLQGAGGNFTSGNDLADFASGASLDDMDNPVARFIFTLLHCPLPVVVAVEGVAVGIGTTLLLHSDLVYAAPDARFRLPFVNLGLCPEFASSLVLPRLAGHVKAAEWLMLGEFFPAEDALDAKLINAITEKPGEQALSQAQKLAQQAPAALRKAKVLMKATDLDATEQVIKNEFMAFGEALRGPEFAEAAAAFFEKRTPDFSSFK